MNTDPRYITLNILEEITQQGGVLDEIIDAFYQKAAHMEKRDRALINAIVFGVLRWRGQLDYIIDSFSKRKINKINRSIKNILRIGLYQIIHLSRIPDAAAVHSAVEMAKTSGFPWAAGYVNAVLRRASREYDSIVYPDKKRDPAANLCAEKSMPEWLIHRWLERFGVNETEALCDAINRIPEITVRINPLNTDIEHFEKSISRDVGEMGRTVYSPCGFHFTRPKKPIHELETFKSGGFQVQDEAAQLVSLLLDPRPGERVLDACAGLGGKTGHIGQLMNNQGTIIACDKDQKKLDRLEIEMNRMRVSIIKTIQADITDASVLKNFDRFDRILLDAPCSGLGVLRRNPDAKWSTIKQNLTYFQKNQIAMLDQLVPLLKPSGILVYAVCSMEPEENESVIHAFLNSHQDFAIDKTGGQLHGKAALLVDEHGFFRTFPHQHPMDGFFAVRLKRNSHL